MNFLSKTGLTPRAILGLMMGALAMTAAACAGGSTTTVSPSGVAPVSLDVNCGNPGGIQNFTMTVTPATLPAPGAAKITVVITNAASSSCNQGLGSAQFTVPADLHFVSVDSMTVSGNKSWSHSQNGSTILVGADQGNQKLDPTESVTLVLNVNPTICKVNTFAQPTAWTATFAEQKTDEFDYVGTTQSVQVDGCVVCNDRHAPAVANDYWMNVLHLPANDPRHGDVISDIGQLTADDGTFMGLTPCQHPAYENAVIAYITNWIATH